MFEGEREREREGVCVCVQERGVGIIISKYYTLRACACVCVCISYHIMCSNQKRGSTVWLSISKSCCSSIRNTICLFVQLISLLRLSN